MSCLNPWDCESKRVFTNDGTYPTLAAYSSRWGMGDGVIYDIHAFDIYNMQSSDSVFKTLNAIRSDADHVPVVYGVYSHPHSSQMIIEGEISPTITVKIAKGSADGPLVLVRRDND